MEIVRKIIIIISNGKVYPFIDMKTQQTARNQQSTLYRDLLAGCVGAAAAKQLGKC